MCHRLRREPASRPALLDAPPPLKFAGLRLPQLLESLLPCAPGARRYSDQARAGRAQLGWAVAEAAQFEIKRPADVLDATELINGERLVERRGSGGDSTQYGNIAHGHRISEGESWNRPQLNGLPSERDRKSDFGKIGCRSWSRRSAN
jgi:hypothetical protein